MEISKNKIISFLIIISAIILIDLIFFEVAMPADNTQVIIGKNLKPGMKLKDAIKLLGPPERITVSSDGTVVIPYDALGLSIEIISNGTVIEKIHVSSSYNVAGGNEADMEAVPEKIGEDIPDGLHEEVREALREELRDEVREELREEEIKGNSEDFDVFDLFGFKVKQASKGVTVMETTPGSAAEKGGLKAGEIIKKAFYEGAGKLNIYTVSGLETILRRSVVKHKKTINILQDKNYYYKVEVPKRR